MQICLIVAKAENNIIGCCGKLPWYLPADLKHFKQVTIGHCVFMGRKTYESIGKPLLGRTNIIISRQKKFLPKGCIVIPSIEEVLNFTKERFEKLFVIGGEQIYRLSLPFVEKIYMTTVYTQAVGEVKFPPLEKKKWKKISSKYYQADKKNPFNYSFTELIKIK